MAEKSPKIHQKSRRYERLLRGEISSQQYVKALKSEALAQRTVRPPRVGRSASASS
jgi:hypothetical protein